MKSYFYLPAHETDEKRACVYRESIGAAPLPLFTEEPARIEVATRCEHLKVLHDIEKEAMPGLKRYFTNVKLQLYEENDYLLLEQGPLLLKPQGYLVSATKSVQGTLH